MRSMRSSVFGMVLALVAASGCATKRETASGVTDTNTNWLKSCDSDASCGGLNCLCGVCTVTCERAQECERFSDQAECATPTTGQCSTSAVCGLPPADSSEQQSTCAECDASASDTSSTVEITSSTETPFSTDHASDVSSGEVTDASTDEATTDDSTSAGDVSSDESSDASSGEPTSTATSDAGDVSTVVDVCTQAVEAMACDSEGTICGGPCTDACQFCNRLICSSGAWQRQETFPAPCISCGDELNCNTLDSYCHVEAGATYACEPYPTECTSDHSCACLESQVDGVCTTDSTGLTLATGQKGAMPMCRRVLGFR